MLKAATPTRSHTAVRAGGGVRTHAKGEQTRAGIVDVALAMAARVGLEGLSIGELATAAGMSKSGVFAHFGSREDLQLTVLEWTADRYARAVIAPAIGIPQSYYQSFARWLAERIPPQRILIVTGNLVPGRLRRMREAGFVVLAKPLAASELAAVLLRAAAPAAA